MTEVLILVGVVLVGWLILQTIRSRAVTPAPPSAQAQPPLPDRLVADPRRFDAGTRVRITHGLLRRTAERAAAQGNRFVVKEGNEVYFVLDAIEDEDERCHAHDVLTRAQDGEQDLDMQELMSVARRLGEG